MVVGGSVGRLVGMCWCVCVCCLCSVVSLCWLLCVLCVLIPSAISVKIAETEPPYQVKRLIGGLGDVLFSTCSQTENRKDPKFHW